SSASQSINLIEGGVTTITVVVTAQDSTINTYTIAVNRAASSDASLSGLELSAGILTPPFASNQATYSVSVANTTATITVTPTANNANATITVDSIEVASSSASQSIALTEGDVTEITIVVTAQDNTINTYTIAVNRAPSSDASLSGLELSAGTLTPPFASNQATYSVSVANTTATITVTPTATNRNATITVDSIEVVSSSASQSINLIEGGVTTITVVVTAQDDTMNTYTIAATRAASSDASLSDLAVSSGELSEPFMSTTLNYTVSVENDIEELTVTPTATNTNATIIVDGTGVNSGDSSQPIALAEGEVTTITIEVTAQAGNINTYTIAVNRALSDDATLSSLILTDSVGDTPVIVAPEPFDARTFDYNAAVLDTVSTVTVIVSSTNENAEIRVGSDEVESGMIFDVALGGPDSATPIEIEVTAQDRMTTRTYTITVNRAERPDANDATLFNLALVANGDAVDFGFDSTTLNHTVSVGNDIEELTVIPTATNGNAAIRVNSGDVSQSIESGDASNAIPLAEGEVTTITVVVTAQDGSMMNTYTVAVSRAASSDASLSGLEVSPGELSETFASTTLNYTVSVENDIERLTVTPTATNDNATIMVNERPVDSGTTSNAIALAEGEVTTITVVVTAQDGTENSYTIAVTRAPSSDASLSSLEVSAGELDPEFSSTTLNYTVLVANSIEELMVTATATNANATITVDGTDVDSGDPSQLIELAEGEVTTITIIVTAQDGTMREYTIAVTRAPSADATLSSLMLTDSVGDTPVRVAPEPFDAGTFDYNAAVLDTVSTVTVTVSAANENAEIRVGSDEVESGMSFDVALGDPGSATDIEIEVTAQDGMTTRTYTITVNRAERPDANDATLFDLALMLTDTDGTRIELSPAFASTRTSYSAGVAHTVGNLAVTPTARNSSATIVVNNTSVSSGDSTEVLLGDVGQSTDIVVTVTAADGSTTASYTVTVSRALSNDATLSNLAVSPGTLSETFGSTTLNYTVSVGNDIEELTVTATATDDNATIMVDDEGVERGSTISAITLTEGAVTTITVVVTAQDGTENTYTIAVTRAPSSDASLSNLEMSAGTLVPPFMSDTPDYRVLVANATGTITVTPTANHPQATITVNDVAVASGNASSAIELAEGEVTTITVVVTAQDSTENTYTIAVSRTASSDASLTDLAVSAGTLMPAFVSDTRGYTVEVVNATATIAVTPTVTNRNATITVNVNNVSVGDPRQPIDLVEGGDTIITIEVTAQDRMTTNSYVVTVSRAASSDATLKTLTVSEGTLMPNFDSSTLTYTVMVANTIDTITVTPTATNENATITVNNVPVDSGDAYTATDLTEGEVTTITIVVTAQDTTTNTYTIAVSRAASSDATLANLAVSEGELSEPFMSTTQNYTVSVTSNIEELTVTPTATDPRATITVIVDETEVETVASGNASQPIELAEGEVTTITIVVTAPDGTRNPYTIAVSRDSRDAIRVRVKVFLEGPLR
ncbi:MAG: cadherin-like beta sandwich domain-containing protein, partial [Chromatiales bacterium]|nr:cadherin-like beta sandwich domain-containing protein [Chromatiales bacterium]